jgi:hypothetical protein
MYFIYRMMLEPWVGHISIEAHCLPSASSLRRQRPPWRKYGPLRLRSLPDPFHEEQTVLILVGLIASGKVE